MSVLFTKDGRSIDIPDNQVIEAVSSGQFYLPANKLGRVEVISPDGQRGSVPQEQALAALQNNFSLAPLSTGLSPTMENLAAAAAGLVRGATAGLSDVVLAQGKLVHPETLQRLERSSPTISPLTEMGGLTAALLATKKVKKSPVALINKVGSLAGKGAESWLLRATSGKLAPKAVNLIVDAATQGGLYGLTDTLHERALGDPEMTAEAIAAQTLKSSLLGAGLGLGFAGVAGITGGVGKLLKSSTVKLAEKMSPELGEQATVEALKTTGMPVSKIAKIRSHLGERRWQDLSDFMFEKPLVLNPKTGQMEPIIIKGLKNAKEVAARWETALDGIGKAYGMTLEEIGMGGPSIIGDEIAAAVQKVFEKARPSMGWGDESLAKFANEMLAKTRQTINQDGWLGGQYTFDELLKYKKQLSSAFEGSSSALKDLHQSVWQALDDVQDATAKRMAASGEIYSRYLGLKRLYGNLVEAARLSDDAAIKQFAEPLSFGSMKSLGKSMLWRMPWMTLGLAERIFAGTAAMGVGGVAVKSAISPASIAVKMYELSKITGIQKIVDATQSRLNETLFNLVHGGIKYGVPASIKIFTEITGEENRQKAFEKYVDRISQLSSDPQAFADKVSSELAPFEEIAPETAAALAKKQAVILAQLVNEIPRPKTGPDLQPQLAKVKVPESMQMAFARKVAVALDPITWLGQVNKLGVTPDEIAIANAVHPKLMESIKVQLVQLLAESERRVEKSLAFALSMIFGTPVMPGMDPAGMALTQQVFAPPQEKQKGISGRALEKIDKIPESYQTRAQRMEKSA